MSVVSTPDEATRAAAAIFVKTPGHSPIKTRLAATLGTAAAQAFHRLSAQAVAAVAAATPGLAAYWAVAEADALDDLAWASLPRFAQAPGDLGARMARACDALRARHGRALLLGADAPQLTVADLAAAIAALDTHDHALGPSDDGGFWLFATRTEVPRAAWTRTPWSQADTGAHFAAALGAARIARLRTLRDVDTADDLAPLLAALEALAAPLPQQRALTRWLREAIPT